MKRAGFIAPITPPIGAQTRVAAVFGDPIAHSLSPAMHNAAYAALGMDRVYIACRVTIARLPEALRAIPALGLIGVNLTVPHKEQALQTVKRLSPEARLLGAANCIVNRPDGLFGDNTDGRGLERALAELGMRLSGRLVIVIGAGGAAAAAVLAALRLGAGRVVVANRTIDRARAMVARFSGKVPGAKPLEAQGLDALSDRALLAQAALVINATPMGLKTARFAPLRYDAAPKDCLFYDLIYSARPTPFLKSAAKAGRMTSDGAGMLLHQGLLAFRLFNGVAAPVEVMRRALMEQLDRSP